MPYSKQTLLARKGRNGDTLLGHLTPGDVVISRERQERDPAFKAKLREIMGDDLDRFTAGSAWNAKNPSTGLAEFAEGGGSAGGGDSGGAGGNGGDSAGGTDPGGTSAGTDVAGVGAGTGSIGGQETGTAAHAAEVGSSPAGDPSTAGGLAASGDQPGAVSNIAHGLLSSIGINTTNAPGLGLTPGLNTNVVDTALSAVPGPLGTGLSVGNRALEAAGVNVGKGIGLATPERGLGDTLAEVAGPGPGGTGGPGTSDVAGGGDPWAGIFADITRDLQPPAAPTSPTIPASTTTPAAPTAAAALANPSQILNQGGFSPETIALLSSYQRQQLGL